MAISRLYTGIVFKACLIAILCIAIGYALGSHLGRSTKPPQIADNQLRLKDQNFPYISALIACSSPDKSYFGEYKALETKMTDYVNAKKRIGEVTSVGIYVRDLQTGHWAGVDETSTFFPASLFKVPIMIAYLKQADADPRILKKRIEGRTVEQLLEAMIIESDNTSKDTLLHYVDPGTLAGVLEDLGIDSPDAIAENEIYTISPRKYSLLFRTLYNATLLSKEMSNYALGLLTKTTYADGMVAPLPREIPVAHKFGFHSASSSPSIGAELHDCGIVYRGQNPYFLCVMTQGNDESSLKPIIQDISRMVYADFLSVNTP